MAKKFKFRYVNEIVGAFVLLVLVLLVCGIWMAGRAQHWFEARYEIDLRFPPEGSMDLQEGAEVMLLGARVGSVRYITVDDDGRISGSIQVRGPFMRFIREDSVALVKKKLVVTGDAYIELSRGTGDELPRTGGYIECRRDTEIMQILEDTLADLKEQASATIDLVNQAIAEYTALAAGMNDPGGNLQQLLGNANGLLEDIRTGEGTPARLLNDPAMAEDIAGAVEQVGLLLESVNAVMADVQQMVAALPPMVDTVGGEVDNLPSVIGDAQTLMRETTATLNGLQKHWLLRKYMESDDALRAEEIMP